MKLVRDRRECLNGSSGRRIALWTPGKTRPISSQQTHRARLNGPERAVPDTEDP
jgi:hypothetical protein